MHSPVGPTRLAELPRAVERIDDPHAIGSDPRPILHAFLGEDLVVRSQFSQCLDDEPVRRPVALVAQRPPVVRGFSDTGSQLEQQFSGSCGDIGGHFVVGEHGLRRYRARLPTNADGMYASGALAPLTTRRW